MDKGEKINAIATFILAIVLGISQVYLALRVYQMEEASLRGEVSILINPIAKQNWTSTANGTSFTIDGTLFNEGSRSAIITKLEVSAKFYFSNGEAYIDPISNYKHDLYLEKDVLTPKESGLFNISQDVRHFLEISRNTGEVIQIYGERPDAIRIIVWYNDGKGEQISINEIQK